MSSVDIQLGGKIRRLKFNKMAELVLQEKIQANNMVSGIYGLIYGGLKANCYVKDEIMDFDFEQVCDWTDEVSEEDLVKVQMAYQETEAYKKGVAYIEEIEAAKKKESSKASKSTRRKASNSL